MLKAVVLRKTFITLCIIFALLFSGVGAAAAPFHGFYIGARFGRMGADLKNNIRARLVTPIPGLVVSLGRGSDGGTAFIGGLSLGYGLLIHRFYLAGEVVGSIYTLSFSTIEQHTDPTSDDVITNIKFVRGYGFNLKPGVLLSQHLLLYGLVGFVETLQQLHFNLAPVMNGQFNRKAYRLGLGLSLALTHCLAFQMQYAIINYPTLIRTGTTEVAPGVVAFIRAQMMPKSYETTGALIFYFH